MVKTQSVIAECDQEQIAKTKAQMKEFFHQLDASFFSSTRNPAGKLKSHLVINDDIPRIAGMDNIEWCEFCEAMAAELINGKATETAETTATPQSQTPASTSTQPRVESMSYQQYKDMCYDNDMDYGMAEMKQAYRAHMRAYYTQDGREVPSKWL